MQLSPLRHCPDAVVVATVGRSLRRFCQGCTHNSASGATSYANHSPYSTQVRLTSAGAGSAAGAQPSCSDRRWIHAAPRCRCASRSAAW